ncbi:MAG TPA: iron uptake system protein EfeO [Candidatus Limnocylindrales bacterium]|nr:iron uptake system protein EfeO [Candidatus Limnocylindrales bacterium]
MPRASTTLPHRAPIGPLSALVGALFLAGCSGQGATPGDSGGPNGSAGTTIVEVTLSADGCPPQPASVPEGPVTVHIKNTDAAAASEVELLQNGAILGEKENLVPGLSGTFSLDLKAGQYILSCPGAKTETATLTVVAATAGGASPTPISSTQLAVGAALARATSGYQAYVRDQVDQLVTATQALAQAVEAGEVAKAKELYGPARVFYERIEPVAESFGDLDPKIDGRIDDAASPADFTGFHRLEQALWIDGRTDAMTPIAQGLVTDVQQLQTLVKTASYQPAQAANGASELLDEVAASKITGEEERYSHLDLLDFQANLDGAQKAFELLQPALTLIDPDLSSTISARFADVQAALAPYQEDGVFVSYTTLTEADTKLLAQKVDALAEPLSHVAAAVVGHG